MVVIRSMCCIVIQVERQGCVDIDHFPLEEKEVEVIDEKVG